MKGHLFEKFFKGRGTSNPKPDSVFVSKPIHHKWEVEIENNRGRIVRWVSPKDKQFVINSCKSKGFKVVE